MIKSELTNIINYLNIYPAGNSFQWFDWCFSSWVRTGLSLCTWSFLLSRTTPGPRVQTPPLIRCTPRRCVATGWWQHHFLWVLVSWPPPAHAAPEPSSAGSLHTGKNQNLNNILDCTVCTMSPLLANSRQATVLPTAFPVTHSTCAVMCVWHHILWVSVNADVTGRCVCSLSMELG